METVFDHHITEDEKDVLGVFYEKHKYIEVFSQDSAYNEIAFLYWHRNNLKKATEYANKIKNVSYKEDCLRTIYHP